MEYVISVDLGGTKITTCLVNKKGKVLEGSRTLTDAGHGRAKVLLNLTGAISAIIKKRKLKISGIGIGVPGFVDRHGKIVFMPNVPLVGFNLKKYLSKKFSCRVAVENDANCFALGEYFFGKHRSRMLLGVIVGTGVGSGIVYDGKLVSGCQGGAGEIGHILLGSSKDILHVGKNDFESCCSGPNISRRYNEAGGGNKLPKQVFASSDSIARKVIADEYDSLGRLLGSMVNALNPDTIVLGGSVSKSIDPAKVKAAIMKYAIPFSAGLVKVRCTRLDDVAAVLGSAALIMRQ
jgi:predicted NBD/HSP70 family sugar kinase